jgi:hypothetical protein
MVRSLISILLVAGLLSAAGCSISASSGSISDSISSPFKSSSASSSDDDDDGGDSGEAESAEARTAYANDVAKLAAAFATQGGELDALKSRVSTLATARGITNWEVDTVTCDGLAVGANEGGMTDAQQETFMGEVCGAPSQRHEQQAHGSDAP